MVIENKNIDNSTVFVKLYDESKKLDAVNFQEAKEKLNTLITDDVINLKLNLESIEFIDSSGISVLISIYKNLLAKEGKLILCSLQDQPKEILNITQLFKLFTIEDEC